MIDIFYIIPFMLPAVAAALAYLPDKIKERSIERKTSKLFRYWMDMRLQERRI